MKLVGELRNARVALARLLAAMRLPGDAGARPQHRHGVRGAYQPRRVS